MRKPALLLLTALLTFTASAGVAGAEVRTLDGSGNNKARTAWGKANTAYLRVAAANYADRVAKPVGGPSSRYVSNRIFNDTSQNLFSENGVTQWGFVWGQFMDHTFGLRVEAGGENAPIPFSSADPLEAFTNTLGSIAFARTPAAAGTGKGTKARQQINTVSSYIDAAGVYGGTNARLEWLREGPVDGKLANNAARLVMQNGYLPRGDARGNAATAPTMALMGRLEAPGGNAKAFVAGDQRANENLGLTATQTLFAREHNRIVAKLPNSLTAEQKFQIARRIVGAEEQWITYQEFLPALGVKLAAYKGYKTAVNPTLGNEFAVVGYRAHSMIHGEFESIGEAADYTPAQLAAIEAQGVEVEVEGDELAFVIPLNLAFGNPDLLKLVGVEAVLHGLGGEPEYKNDEMIDNQLRSVLFQVPVSGNPGCLDGPTLPQCFQGVADLGAIDLERGRDHGMPLYNDLRKAFGLAKKTSFTAITGEATDQFPNDAAITGNPIDDPSILDFVALFDADGNSIPLGSEAADAEAVTGVRRTTLAARLKAIYGDVSKIDAFVGMLSEKHVAGTEFGELQLAMWKKQFTALRDGDRFFYGSDAAELKAIKQKYGITFQKTLAQIIEQNTGIDVQDNVFVAVEEPARAG